MCESINIPIWKKVALTIKEGCVYSNIGEKTMRELLNRPSCPFVLCIGNKKLIKRQIFEEWLMKQDEIG